jgi:hypothetical protein
MTIPTPAPSRLEEAEGHIRALIRGWTTPSESLEDIQRAAQAFLSTPGEAVEAKPGVQAGVFGGLKDVPLGPHLTAAQSGPAPGVCRIVDAATLLPARPAFDQPVPAQPDDDGSAGFDEVSEIQKFEEWFREAINLDPTFVFERNKLGHYQTVMAYHQWPCWLARARQSHAEIARLKWLANEFADDLTAERKAKNQAVLAARAEAIEKVATLHDRQQVQPIGDLERSWHQKWAAQIRALATQPEQP